MKAKSLLAGIMLLALLLTGCKKPDVKTAQLSLDRTPTVSDHIIYINDEKAGPVYQQKGAYYLDAETMAKALGGTVEIFEGMEEHQAVMSIGKDTYSFTTFNAPQTGTTIYCYKGSLYDGKKFYCPVEALTEYFGLKMTQDYSKGHVYHYGEYKVSDMIPNGIKVPTLMYHAVSDNCWGIDSLFLSPSKMEEQLKWLTENNYTPIWFEDLPRLKEIKKPILLTFDDGYQDNYTELFPLLKKYQVKATVFMITGSIGAENYLTEAQIKEMNASGLVSFQSHTVSHRLLTDISAEDLATELKQSKETLYNLTGKKPFVFCYPTGKQNAKVREAVAKEYQFALLMSGDTWVTGEDPLLIHRKFVSRSTSMSQFKKWCN